MRKKANDQNKKQLTALTQAKLRKLAAGAQAGTRGRDHHKGHHALILLGNGELPR